MISPRDVKPVTDLTLPGTESKETAEKNSQDEFDNVEVEALSDPL